MDTTTVAWPGWDVVRKIGSGSFGAVYEIERKVLDKTEKAALKVITIPQDAGDIDELYSDGYDDESITQRYKSYLEDIIREYSMMAEMKGHTNVVYCDDFRYIQHDDGIGWDIYIKMELLTPLTKTLPKEIPEDQIIKIGVDLCNALKLCEDRNIVHRDIKPQNIFASADGNYKLGDFGIAKTAERTTSGTKIGTYKYMAPEVYNNQPYGHGADLYSLGLVLYWLLNERRTPFLPMPPKVPTTTEEDEARKKRFSGEKITAPAHGSEELKRIVLKACAYDPKDRYHTAEELQEDLVSLASGIPAPQKKTTPEPLVIDEEETISARNHSARNDSLEEEDEDETVSAFRKKEVKDSGAGAADKRSNMGLWIGAIAAALLIVVGIALHAILSKQQQVDVSSETIASSENTVSPSEPDLAVVEAAESQPEPTPSVVPQNTETPEPMVQVSVGDRLLFGAYEQDGYESNGSEDIEWIVLAKNDTSVLLISAYCIDCWCYDTYSESVTWQTCSMREWLNDGFIESAFSEDEQQAILNVSLENPSNSQFGTNGGGSTRDRVFLLSLEEAEMYFATNSERQAKGTSYAKSEGIYVNQYATSSFSNQHIDGSGYGYSWWWLRSPGESSDMAACVVSDGNFNYHGSSVVSKDGGIRPAMWVDVSSCGSLNVVG